MQRESTEPEQSADTVESPRSSVNGSAKPDGPCRFREWISPTAIAMDLGSENSRAVSARADAPVRTHPSIIAVNKETDAVLALGEEARRMLGRAPPTIGVEQPIRNGLIARPYQAEILIWTLMTEGRSRWTPFRPHVVLASAAEASSIQRRALVTAARSAGAGRVTLIRESLAAAMGAGLPVSEPEASLVIEMGAQKTEVAVISLGGIVASATLPIGGLNVSEAIAAHLYRKHHFVIGLPTAHEIKIAIAEATATGEPRAWRARGRDAKRGVPAALEIKSDELVGPVQDVLQVIVTTARNVLEETPPELSADIASSGIHLSGGASRLSGLVEYFETEMNLTTRVASEPENAVVRGCQRCAASPATLRALARFE